MSYRDRGATGTARSPSGRRVSRKPDHVLVIVKFTRASGAIFTSGGPLPGVALARLFDSGGGMSKTGHWRSASIQSRSLGRRAAGGKIGRRREGHNVVMPALVIACHGHPRLAFRRAAARKTWMAGTSQDK